jgi:UDP-glucose:(heptosyl)LPS alpha-1,3-glucosyltransferase
VKLALIRRKYSATGGAELYLQRLLGALTQRGHELHLFAEAWAEKPEGVTLHPIRVDGTRAHKPVSFARGVQAELAKEKFDCVFSLERTLQQDVYRAGDGVHRVWLERRREFAPWWKRPFIGLGAFHRNMLDLESRTFDPANTRRIIVNSEMVKREILAHFQFPPDRIHLVRNGVEVARFQKGERAATRAGLGIGDRDYVILFVGSGWERKGLQYLIRALPVSSRVQVRLLVVGKGRRPGGAPANVIFAGEMSDVENAYAAADLFVFLPIYEPSSNVVAEALAAGLPVVTTAQNGASELIAGGVNGSVIPSPTDTEMATDAMRFWLERRSRPAAPPGAALSLDRNVAETLAVLEQTAQERAA